MTTILFFKRILEKCLKLKHWDKKNNSKIRKSIKCGLKFLVIIYWDHCSLSQLYKKNVVCTKHSMGFQSWRLQLEVTLLIDTLHCGHSVYKSIRPLIFLATNNTLQHSFSDGKTYFFYFGYPDLSFATQTRFSHLTILNTHKQRTDKLCVVAVAKEFVQL